ncbi:HAMP domain-containing sensor histidine kinase [Arcobacter vandammei]|uniref:HAMP domain-containing sensor histidine kinase n=1 Tax=Arcobacter vandammei TaxID=2782243 RepID=UPI0018DF8B53|nr:ATP-binding protein [Arcobacter vandammei]
MLKIHKLFFRSFLLIFLITVFTITLLVYFWAKKLYIDEIKTNLSQNIDTFLTVFSKEDLGNSQNIVKDLGKKLNLRVSLIDENGYVLADSEDLELIENHLNREEIINANKNSFSYSLRFSNSLQKELLYLAKRFELNGKIYYLRMSDFTDKIFDNFQKLLIEIIVYILAFLFLSFFISYLLSLKIKKEMDLILNFLVNLTKNRDKLTLKSNFTFEFYKIAKLLNKVAKKLAKQDEIKAKHTAKLKLANRQKDELISSLSHEFKNPIAIISGYSQTLLEDENIKKELQIKFLTKIYSNSIKLAQIIDKLRLSLRLQEKQQELLKTKINLHTLVETCVSDLKIKYKNREINIERNEVFIDADETLISIAISNIIENALKYSSKDIEIKIEKDCLSIVDFGIGISQNDIEKIDKKFYRASSNEWNNSLGLGLFIVQSILKLHNFKLEISSKENIGSTFKIHY